MRKLLVPIDSEEGMDRAVNKASILAEAFNSEVRIVYIIPPLPYEVRNKLEVNSVSTMGDMVGMLMSSNSYESIRDDMAGSLKKIHNKMLEIKKELMDRGLNVEAYIYEGKLEDSILEEAMAYQPDLIIMNSQVHSYRFKSMIGGVYSTIIRNVSCPVMVIPPVKSNTQRKRKSV